MGLFSGIKKIFGFGDDDDKKQPDMGYTGTRPYTSIMNTEIGKKLAPYLLSQIGGQNIGMTPEMLNQVTSPLVQNRLQQYRDFEKPAIESAASARGLGRSTIATDQLRRSAQGASMDASQILANAILQNEQMKAQQKRAAQSLLANLLGQETGVRQQASNYDYTNYINQLNQRNLQDQLSPGNKLLQFGGDLSKLALLLAI